MNLVLDTDTGQILSNHDTSLYYQKQHQQLWIGFFLLLFFIYWKQTRIFALFYAAFGLYYGKISCEWNCSPPFDGIIGPLVAWPYMIGVLGWL